MKSSRKRNQSMGQSVLNFDDRKIKKRFFVSNIPQCIDDKALRALFEKYGKVEEARVVIDKETLKSKHYGFVTMGSECDAREAMFYINKRLVQGKEIMLKEAKPKPKQKPHQEKPNAWKAPELLPKKKSFWEGNNKQSVVKYPFG